MSKKKIISITQAVKIAATARKAGKKVVASNGCFDILHVGHVRNLQAARKLGDLLMVGVNSDDSVREHKGDLRPIISAPERAEMLAGLACVDYVFIFRSTSPIPWLKKIRPSIHVKGVGSELSPVFAKEKQAVENAGGTMHLAKQTKGRSTTSIIEIIIRKYKK